MRIQPWIFFLLTGLTVFSACGGKYTDYETDLEPVSVRITEAGYQSIPTIVEAPGTVQPRNRIALASQINGFVRETPVQTGDRVKAGQTLLTLDARDAENQKAAAESGVLEAQAALSEARQGYEAALEMKAASKASLDLANQTFARYEKLFESRSVSPQEMDEVRSRRDAARAESASRESMVAAAEDRIKQVEARIAQAKAQAGRADVLMSYTRIVAPESGIIVQRHVDGGSAIFPGSPLLTLDTTARPQVLASLPVDQASGLQIGMECTLGDTQNEPLIKGRISEIAPQSDPTTHSVQFKVDLPQGTDVMHGKYLKISIPAAERNALLIEKNAVTREGQLEGLFAVEEGNIARFRLVKTAPYDSEQLEILSGIEPGESIITHSEGRIIDGIPVEIER
ncbi:MAG: efflux RND transporter periplasmic adaptor subunit [Acidobacteriota bacterium]